MPVGAPSAAPAPKRSRRLLLWLGLVVVVAGLAVGGALFAMSGSRYDDAVKKLARAPAGCTTTLDFEKTGTFIVYVETKGEVGDVAGDCAGNGTSYERDAGDLPDVSLRLVDPDDDEVDLDDREGVAYDAAGFRGESIHSVRIDTTGRYRLTVSSEDTDFAIAVGKDPEGDSATMKSLGLGVAVAGLVAGAVLMLLGRRRGGPAPAQPTMTTAAPGWPPQPAAPAPPFGGAAPSGPVGGGFAPPRPPDGGQQGWGAPPQQ